MSFYAIIETVGKAIDGIGVLVIAGGALVAARMRLARLRTTDGDPYRLFRQQLGRSILLGLELLVAADIIRTVAVTPNAQSVAVLGGIVLIRTFLSFSLQVEVSGAWPWQKRPRCRPRKRRSTHGRNELADTLFADVPNSKCPSMIPTLTSGGGSDERESSVMPTEMASMTCGGYRRLPTVRRAIKKGPQNRRAPGSCDDAGGGPADQSGHCTSADRRLAIHHQRGAGCGTATVRESWCRGGGSAWWRPRRG
jgi:uncharacterized membrane protein